MPWWVASLLDLVTKSHDCLSRLSHWCGYRMVRLVGKIEAGKNSSPFFTEPIVDPPDDICPNDPSKADSRSNAIVLEAHILVRIEYLPGIDKRRDFKISHDTGQACSQYMNAFLNTEGNQLFIDVPIDTESTQIVLPPQRALLIKRNVRAERGLQIAANHQNRPLGLARKHLFDLETIPGIHGIYALMEIVIELRISR